MPIDSWLRGPLRGWADVLLSEATFKKHNLLNRKSLQEKWQEHKMNRRNWQYHLWEALMPHAWVEEYL